MKKRAFTLALTLFCSFHFAFAQSVGIGTSSPDAFLHLFNPNAVSGAGTRIAFGDDITGGGLRAYIAEYGWQLNADNDVLELHGSNGINFTRGVSTGTLLNSMEILNTGVVRLNVVNTDNTAPDFMVRQGDGSLALRQLSTIPANLAVLNEDVANNRVGIGTSSPVFSLDIVHQNGSPSGGSPDPHNGLNIRNIGANMENWTLYVSNTSGNLQFYNQGVLEVEFSDEGNIDLVSDARAKRNIRSLDNATMPRLMQLIPRQYVYNHSKTGKTSYGFLAQETMKIFPGLVNYHENNDDGVNAFSVNYIGFIPFLVKGMQEQQNIITGQNNKIRLLENERKEILSRLEKIELLLSKQHLK